eukprot:9397194-Pyramimonas_sp.AAC.1
MPRAMNRAGAPVRDGAKLRLHMICSGTTVNGCRIGLCFSPVDVHSPLAIQKAACALGRGGRPACARNVLLQRRAQDAAI